jgi:hypothetical protein
LPLKLVVVQSPHYRTRGGSHPHYLVDYKGHKIITTALDSKKHVRAAFGAQLPVNIHN